MLFTAAVRARRWPGARSFRRVGRRTLVDSLYLLTGPVTAAAGLLLVLGGLGIGTAGLLVPGGSRFGTRVLAPARWFADLERWRIAKVHPPAPGAEGASQRPRPKGAAAASDPGLWLDVAHAVVALPVALATAVVTVLWWFVGVMAATVIPRGGYTAGSLRPEHLSVGGAQTHIDLSLGLTSPDGQR